MNKILSVLLGMIICVPVFGATSRTGHVGTNARIGVQSVQKTSSMKQSSSVAVVDNNPVTYPKDTREQEKMACLNNNIGIGNTFVWASRYSSTANYATMVEDKDNPENNVCFVKVSLKSEDSRISVDDIPSKYFMWGDVITCGSWVDANVMNERILDGKKSARVWGTIGGTVGGAALGVGAMELFGNKLIGGKVEGQAALQGADLLYSQIKSLDENSGDYAEITNDLKKLKEKCDAIKDAKPSACSGKYYQVAKMLDL